MKISNIWRLLRILLIFSRKSKVKAKELAEELEISTRQVYRDIEGLKLAGIPIYSDRTGFAVMPDFFMPKINLEIPEALTLFMLCSSAKSQQGTPYSQILNSASDKILNVLPPKLKSMFGEGRYDRIVDFGFDLKIDYREIDDIFNLLYAASIEKKRIKIRYLSMKSDTAKERIIDPYAFKLYFGIWYLIGFCHLRGELRTFRVDRIKSAAILNEDFTLPEDFNIDRFFKDSWGIIKGQKYRVSVLFGPKVARFVSEIKWHPSQKFTRLKDGRLAAEFEVMGLNEIKIWILGFGEDAEVLQPLQLREDIIKTADNITRVYKK